MLDQAGKDSMAMPGIIFLNMKMPLMDGSKLVHSVNGT